MRAVAFKQCQGTERGFLVITASRMSRLYRVAARSAGRVPCFVRVSEKRFWTKIELERKRGGRIDLRAMSRSHQMRLPVSSPDSGLYNAKSWDLNPIFNRIACTLYERIKRKRMTLQNDCPSISMSFEHTMYV